MRGARFLVFVMLAAATLLVAYGPVAEAQTPQTADPALASALDKTESALTQTGLTQTLAQRMVDLMQSDVTKLQAQNSGATLSQQDQLELQLRMTEIQQEWTAISQALQTLNQTYTSISDNYRTGAAETTDGATGVSSDFDQTVAALQQYQQQAQAALQELQTASSGGVTLGTMFHLQFQMQMMSQYIESVSNVLQAVHNEMITMAKATKGQ
jgi:hypothetical protein